MDCISQRGMGKALGIPLDPWPLASRLERWKHELVGSVKKLVEYVGTCSNHCSVYSLNRLAAMHKARICKFAFVEACVRQEKPCHLSPGSFQLSKIIRRTVCVSEREWFLSKYCCVLIGADYYGRALLVHQLRGWIHLKEIMPNTIRTNR